MGAKELGRLIKSQYPEYADLPDEEVGILIAERYPEYRDFLSSESSSHLVRSGRMGMIPDHWDERTVGHDLDRYRNQPDVLAHYVDNIKKRFITGQDTKTIKKRTDFIRAQIERLQVGKEYMTLIRELQRLQDEEDAKDEKAKMDLEQARRDRESRAFLHEEELDLKQLKIQMKKAKVLKKIRDLEREAQPQPQTSPGDERQRQKERLQKEIERLKEEKKKDAAAAADDEERIETENMYDDAIRKVKEKLRDFL